MEKVFEILLKNEPIKESKNLDFVRDNTAGGICQFVGVVRDNSQNKKVLALEFEAYLPMAKKEIEKIINQSFAKFELLRISVHHAIGYREVGETCVAIAVSSKHRKEAFQACQFIIDELKKTVPIWKKEIYEDGQSWVSAHP